MPWLFTESDNFCKLHGLVPDYVGYLYVFSWLIYKIIRQLYFKDIKKIYQGKAVSKLGGCKHFEFGRETRNRFETDLWNSLSKGLRKFWQGVITPALICFKCNYSRCRRDSAFTAMWNMAVADSIKSVANLNCSIISDVCIDSCRVLREITTYKSSWMSLCIE